MAIVIILVFMAFLLLKLWIIFTPNVFHKQEVTSLPNLKLKGEDIGSLLTSKYNYLCPLVTVGPTHDKLKRGLHSSLPYGNTWLQERPPRHRPGMDH